MGTSAVIRVEGNKSAELYKHWDGYTDATLPWLLKFNHQFTQMRGNDPEYKLAQLVRSSALMQDEFGLDPSTDTGWGLCAVDSCYGDYQYLLKEDGGVQVRGEVHYYEN